MKEILISLNKAVMTEMQEPGTAYILCISDPQMQTADSARIMQLFFQDITNEKSKDAFQKEHAERIVCFFERVQQNDQIDCIFVCCDAGISRSPAIAAALMREQGQNDDCIWSDAEYDPNPLVYRRLCHAFGHPVTSTELRIKLRLNRIAWNKKFYNDLCESLKEVAAYERGDITLEVE